MRQQTEHPGGPSEAHDERYRAGVPASWTEGEPLTTGEGLDKLAARADVGEVNTASNVNAGGVGVFKQKTGVDLEFRGVNAGSSKSTVALDAANNEIDIDVDPSQIASSELSDGGDLVKGPASAALDRLAAFADSTGKLLKDSLIFAKGETTTRIEGLSALIFRLGRFDGVTFFQCAGSSTSVNYLSAQSSAAGSSPDLTPAGTDANLDNNLRRKGTGKVNANQDGTDREVATIDGTQTVTNKTIDGNSNTLTVLAASQLSGATPIANGGTGETGKTAAFDALSPNTTKGDLAVHDGTDNVRLPVGTDGQALESDSAATQGVSWKSRPKETYGRWNGLTMQFPDTDYAVPDNLDNIVGAEQLVDTEIRFGGYLDDAYADDGLNVVIIWRAVATTGNVKFEAAFQRVRDGDSSTRAFAIAQNTQIAVSGTTKNWNKTTITFTHAQLDSMTKADNFMLRVKRVAASVSEMSGGALVAFVQVIGV